MTSQTVLTSSGGRVASGFMTAARGTWDCLAISDVQGILYDVHLIYRGLAFPGEQRKKCRQVSVKFILRTESFFLFLFFFI